MSFLKNIANLMTRDLTGKTWVREASHQYFERLTHFGSRKAEGSYWEAELQIPGEAVRIGVNMTGTPEGPTEKEQAFCQMAVADLNLLFERCRAAFEPEFLAWTRQPMPAEWRGTFKLDGFQVPVGGDPSNDWELCYFVEPIGHYFTAVFENGEVAHVAVDG